MEDVTYLWVAEAVLRKHKRPLNARALVNYGLEDGLFPASGLSHTPQKSMQARLSIDILNNPESNFIRTGRGRFYLRDMLPLDAVNDPTALQVYTAERRTPGPSAEMVLCVSRENYEGILQYQGMGFVGEPNPLEGLSEQQFGYLPRSIAEVDDDYKQVITYTIIQHQSKILCFRRGLYNRAASFLRGAQCVGFGGHVSEEDRDLFSMRDLGVRQNAAREISEELVLPRGKPSIDPASLEFLGILNDDSSDVGVRHAAVVLRYWVDDWAEWRYVAKGEASINKLRWIDTAKDEINLSEFEYWSQIVIRAFFTSSIKMAPSYKIQRAAGLSEDHILCIVGSIGSGKSVTSRFFEERMAYVGINSGQVLASLLGIPPIPQTPRAKFQASAEDFISRADGPARLGEALARAAGETNSGRILVDGIRHPATFEALKASSKMPVVLLYVYTPPDVAYQMYRYREGHNERLITFSDFIKLYTAPVESQIRYLLGDADIITFNWLGIEGYERTLAALSEKLYAK